MDMDKFRCSTDFSSAPVTVQNRSISATLGCLSVSVQELYQCSAVSVSSSLRTILVPLFEGCDSATHSIKERLVG